MQQANTMLSDAFGSSKTSQYVALQTWPRWCQVWQPPIRAGSCMHRRDGFTETTVHHGVYKYLRNLLCGVCLLHEYPVLRARYYLFDTDLLRGICIDIALSFFTQCTDDI